MSSFAVITNEKFYIAIGLTIVIVSHMIVLCNFAKELYILFVFCRR